MELVTSRLLLRELDPSDWREVYAYESDPEVVRYETFGPVTAEETVAYIERAIEDATDDPRLTWDLAVVLRRSKRLIGRVGVQLTRPDQREGTLWYILQKSAWGHGYATEAARAMAGFAFAEVNVHRLVADVDPRNGPSIRVLEKLGMRREGLSKESQLVRGTWCDLAHYAILDREWAGIVEPVKPNDGAARAPRARGARARRA